MVDHSRRLPVAGITGAMPAPLYVDVLHCWPGRPVEYEVPPGTARVVITAPEAFIVRPNGPPTVEYTRRSNSYLDVLDGTGGMSGQHFDWLTDGVESLVFIAAPVAGLSRQVAISVACYGKADK